MRKQQKGISRQGIFIWALLGILMAGDPQSACAKNQPSRSGEPVRIGIGKQISSSLAILADKKGLFATAGLNAKTVFYPSGPRVLEALRRDEIDIAMGVADVPFVKESFENKDLTIFAALGGSDRTKKIIARKSSGIHRPEDLAGKRVATQEASAVHFFLDLFLAYHGIL